MGIPSSVGLILFAIVVVDLVVLAAINKSEKATQVKTAWSLIVIVLPVIGWSLWLIAGPQAAARDAADLPHFN